MTSTSTHRPHQEGGAVQALASTALHLGRGGSKSASICPLYCLDCKQVFRALSVIACSLHSHSHPRACECPSATRDHLCGGCWVPNHKSRLAAAPTRIPRALRVTGCRHPSLSVVLWWSHAITCGRWHRGPENLSRVAIRTSECLS